jgi:hypothetical protein
MSALLADLPAFLSRIVFVSEAALGGRQRLGANDEVIGQQATICRLLGVQLTARGSAGIESWGH